MTIESTDIQKNRSAARIQEEESLRDPARQGRHARFVRGKPTTATRLDAVEFCDATATAFAPFICPKSDIDGNRRLKQPAANSEPILFLIYALLLIKRMVCVERRRLRHRRAIHDARSLAAGFASSAIHWTVLHFIGFSALVMGTRHIALPAFTDLREDESLRRIDP